MYTAHAALELYALAFVEAGCLSEKNLRAFACENGADFYGLPRNEGGAPGQPSIILRPEPWQVPPSYEFGDGGAVVVPALAGETLPWKAVVERGAL